MIVWILKINNKVDMNRGRFHGAFSSEDRANQYLATMDPQFSWAFEVVPAKLDELLEQ